MTFFANHPLARMQVYLVVLTFSHFYYPIVMLYKNAFSYLKAYYSFGCYEVVSSLFSCTFLYVSGKDSTVSAKIFIYIVFLVSAFTFHPWSRVDYIWHTCLYYMFPVISN